MNKCKLAIIGLGKIARDQHVPALLASPDFELSGVASPHDALASVISCLDLESLLKAVPDIEAVSICTPPQVRYETARLALAHGLHVLLEKPPCVTVSEALTLGEFARRKGVALFASWHSRHAAAVAPARLWSDSQRIRNIVVTWQEDVRVWHPGQRWIWEAGGLGVFDPGINALSLLTVIVPGPLALRRAQLRYPRNCETPIAAQLHLESSCGVPIQVELDFLYSGLQQWNIDIETDSSVCRLAMGGSELFIDQQKIQVGENTEYTALYASFAALIRGRSIDVDVAPLQLVADAFLRGERLEVEPFFE